MNTATQKADATEVYGNQVTLENLDYGNDYVLRVFGLNSQGAGSPSDIITVRTGDNFGTPGPPIPPTEPPTRGTLTVI